MAAPLGAAAFPVEGSARASSAAVEDQGYLEGRTYLVGFRTDPNDESAYQWGFQAEEVEVHLERRHYMGDMFPIHQGTTERTVTHANASGVLLERFPLAYFMALSADPDDPDFSYGLRIDLPVDSLELRRDVAFNTDRLEENDELPFQDANPLNSRWNREYRQPWDNLFRTLEDETTPLTLHGNFTLHVWEMKFEVRNGTGEEAVYNATYGGARGDDVPSPVHEYNNTFAELRFTNASFTFLPAGRPLQLNLRSAATDVTGAAYLSDVQGSLNHGGVDVSLDGSLVEFDAEDLRLDVRPVDDGGTLRFGVGFEGLVDAAAVDGRPLDFDAAEDATNEPQQEESGFAGTIVAPESAVGTDWWMLVALVAAVAVLAGAGRRAMASRQARINPGFVVEQGELALDRGHYSRARSLAGRVLRHHPDHHDAVALHAMTHINRKETGKAIAFLQPYVLGPADDGGLLSLVYCMALRKEHGVEEARAFFRKAVKVHPAMVEVAGEYADVAHDFLGEDGAAGDASYS